MEFVILIILFWAPALIVIFKDILWNLHLWEIKEYRWERFISNLYWDQEPENRHPIISSFKFILFSLISTIFLTPDLALFGVFLTYFLWCYEAFAILEKFYKHEIKPVSIFKLRNIAVFGLFILFLVTIIFSLAVPFFFLNRVLNNNIDFSTGANLSNIMVQSSFVYPNVLIYLSISALIALFIDISSPVILAVFIVLTNPISWIQNKVTENNLIAKLHKHRSNIKVIAVSGSQGKTAVKELLQHFIKDKYETLSTSDIYSSPHSLSKEILDKLTSKTKVIILEVESYKQGEIKRMFEIFRPDISIITDVNLAHIGLFRNVQEFLISQLEIAKYMNANGTLIVNGDNKYASKLIRYFPGEKIVYTMRNTNRYSNAETVRALGLKRSDKGYSFKLKQGNLETLLKTQFNRKFSIEASIPAIVTAEILGLNINHILKTLEKLKDHAINFYTVKGENNSILLVNTSSEVHYKSTLSNINYAINLQKARKSGKIILVTNGIKELGRYKRKIYLNLVDKIKNSIGGLITTDALLHKIFEDESRAAISVRVQNESEIVYEIRKILSPNDIIILNGNIPDEVISELRLEES